jgi:hypothetical protein
MPAAPLPASQPPTHLVGVLLHLWLLVKHDARRLHDQLDARGRVLQALDLHDVIPGGAGVEFGVGWGAAEGGGVRMLQPQNSPARASRMQPGRFPPTPTG